MAAYMNLSDGQADALGLFDDPRPMQQFNPSSDIRDTIAVPTPRQNQMTSRAGAFIPEATTPAPSASVSPTTTARGLMSKLSQASSPSTSIGGFFPSLVGLKAANGSAGGTPVVGNVAIRADRTPKPEGIVPLTPPTPKVKRQMPARKPLPVMTAPIRFNRFTR